MQMAGPRQDPRENHHVGALWRVLSNNVVSSIHRPPFLVSGISHLCWLLLPVTRLPVMSSRGPHFMSRSNVSPKANRSQGPRRLGPSVLSRPAPASPEWEKLVTPWAQVCYPFSLCLSSSSREHWDGGWQS